MTSPTRIVINVAGGLVQEVGSSDPSVEVIVVDWDCNEEDCGVRVSTSTGGHKSAWITELVPCRLSDFTGTEVEAAIRAYRHDDGKAPSA